MLYNVDDLPQTLMSNPGARIDFVGHVGLPFFSQIHLFAGSSGASVHDIFADDGNNINDRISRTMNNMTAGDFVSANEQLEIISLGWKIDRRNYLSVGIYQEMDVFAYFPKDLAILANEGNNDYLDKAFDFSQVAFEGEVLTVYHLGLNHKFDNKLTVGARAKLYSGIFNAETSGNTGTFTTYDTPDGRNFYRHEVSNLDVVINTSGFSTLRDTQGMTVDRATGDLLSRSFFGGNIGAGLDLGLSYLMHEQLILTASVQDLGMMFQTKDVENYHYFGNYTTEGIEPLFPEIEPDGSTLPYWDIFEDELEENLRDETYNRKYVTWRPVKMNLSAEFGFGPAFMPCDYLTVPKIRFMNLIGMQMAAVKRPKGLIYTLSTYWDRKINETQRFRVAYTLDDYSLTNLGLMYTSTFKNFNVYLATYNVLAFPNLAKAHSASIQLGLQLVFDEF